MAATLKSVRRAPSRDQFVARYLPAEQASGVEQEFTAFTQVEIEQRLAKFIQANALRRADVFLNGEPIARWNEGTRTFDSVSGTIGWATSHAEQVGMYQGFRTRVTVHEHPLVKRWRVHAFLGSRRDEDVQLLLAASWADDSRSALNVGLAAAKQAADRAVQMDQSEKAAVRRSKL